jgi:hypothetical protein
MKITLLLLAIILSSCTLSTPTGYTYKLEVTHEEVAAAIAALNGGKTVKNVQP